MNNQTEFGLYFFILVFGFVLLVSGCVTRADYPLDNTQNNDFQITSTEEKNDSPVMGCCLPEGEVTVGDALEVALANNRELKIEKLKIPQSRLEVVSSAAEFDPRLSAGIRENTRFTERETETTEGYQVVQGRSRQVSGDIGLSKQFWLGTEIGVEFGAVADRTDEEYESDLGLDITQPLLQGAGEVNLVGLRQSKLAAKITEHQFKGYLDSLLEEIETAYWELVLSGQRRDILRRDVKLAEENLEEVQRRIEVGRLAADEEAAGRAQLASARGSWLEARDQYEQNKLNFLQKLNVENWEDFERELELAEPPAPEEKIKPVSRWLEFAEENRPELLEARLRLRNNELELIRTANGLLPRLDFFVTLGTTGYAETLGEAIEDIDGTNYNISGGLNFNLPVGRRQARSSDEQEKLSYRQQKLSLDNLEESVSLDVRDAYMAVKQARRQIEANRAIREEREATLEAEKARFQTGKIAYIQMARARQELTQSRLDELESLIEHRLARLRLYRLSGRLAARRGYTF
ncbi:MAG: TolC family protein [bacterium]